MSSPLFVKSSGLPWADMIDDDAEDAALQDMLVTELPPLELLEDAALQDMLVTELPPLELLEERTSAPELPQLELGEDALRDSSSASSDECHQNGGVGVVALSFSVQPRKRPRFKVLASLFLALVAATSLVFFLASDASVLFPTLSLAWTWLDSQGGGDFNPDGFSPSPPFLPTAKILRFNLPVSAGPGLPSTVLPSLARFCLSVDPEADLSLEVAEEANYEECIPLTEISIARFLSTRTKTLKDEKVLDEKSIGLLHRGLGRLRLGSMLKAFLEPKNISEEQLLNWEQKECPWSSDEFTNSDPDGLASDVREILVQIRELQSKMAETKENQRKQSADNSRVAKIFENQTRLRENIKSMEHVRTGSLLERYMNDMDKEENDLIQTRQRIEQSEEQHAKLNNDASRLALQIVMKTKALQKRAKC